MTLLHILILSVIQGLTEFLPVSSSGHLVLVPLVTGTADQGIVMDVAVHIGTLLAIIVYYWKDLWRIGISCLFWKKNKGSAAQMLGIYIILATIPAVIFGLLIHVFIPEGIRDVRIITATTIFYGILMGYADLKSPKEKNLSHMTLKSALIVGFAQALALIPGTSRSGVTMTAARFMGFNRVDAARFSFLLGVPSIAAAGCLGLLDLVKSGDVAQMTDVGIAVFLAFLAGLGAIFFMMKWLQKFGLMPFVIYRMILGVGLLAYLLV